MLVVGELFGLPPADGAGQTAELGDPHLFNPVVRSVEGSPGLDETVGPVDVS